jgi:hypothetical protein
MAWYNNSWLKRKKLTVLANGSVAGTIAVTNLLPSVVGTGTHFTQWNVGSQIQLPDGNWYTVLSITTDLALTISVNYPGGTLGGQPYTMRLVNYQMLLNVFKNNDTHLFEAGWNLTANLFNDGNSDVDFFLTKIGLTYFLYFASNRPSGSNLSIYLATASSPNGPYTLYSTTPVLAHGGVGNWKSFRANAPYVVLDGGTYYMFYEGYNSTNAGIGYATSADGYAWADQSTSSPLLAHGSSGWDVTDRGTPSIIKNGSTYYLFFHGDNGTNLSIGYATASSITGPYTPYASNPVLTKGSAGTWDAGWVGKRDIFSYGGTFVMFYEGDPGPGLGINQTQMGFATSPDLISWTKDSANPIFKTTTLAQLGICQGSVYVEGSSYYFVGTDYPGAGVNGQLDLYQTATPDYSGRVCLNGHVLNSFNDIRFTKPDGITLVPQRIDPVTLVSGISAIVTVNFDYVPAGSELPYIYYNNPAASDVSSGPSTFIAFDDMERGVDGNAIGGAWTVVTGAVNIATAQHYSGTRSAKWLGAAANPEATLPVTNDGIAIQYRIYQAAVRQFYLFHGNGTKNVHVLIDPTTNSHFYTYDTAYHDTGQLMGTGAWHKVEIRNFNWNAAVYDLLYDDRLIANGVSMQTGATATNKLDLNEYPGTVGMDTYIDDVIVRNFISPEPMFGTWGAEETLLIGGKATGIGNKMVAAGMI